MRTIVLAMVMLASIIMAGCALPVEKAASQDSEHWSYLVGPNGEHCLVYSSNISYPAGLFAMSCDSVNWRESN